MKQEARITPHFQKMEVSDSSLDEGGEEGDVSEKMWDVIEEVNSSFINKGKSREPGMLTTHDMRFKVLKYVM